MAHARFVPSELRGECDVMIDHNNPQHGVTTFPITRITNTSDKGQVRTKRMDDMKVIDQAE